MTTKIAKADATAKTRSVLSKYGSPTIIAKLEAGTLLGLSKTIALEILTKRGEKDPASKDAAKKYAGETYVKPGSAATPKVSSKTEKEEVSAKPEKVVKKEEPAKAVKGAKAAEKPAKSEKTAKTEKEKKAPAAKKEKAASVDIDETLPAVKKILNDEEANKSSKIKSLLTLGYTPKQICKIESLAVIYQYCYNVQGKMKEA